MNIRIVLGETVLVLNELQKGTRTTKRNLGKRCEHAEEEIEKSCLHLRFGLVVWSFLSFASLIR